MTDRSVKAFSKTHQNPKSSFERNPTDGGRNRDIQGLYESSDRNAYPKLKASIFGKAIRQRRPKLNFNWNNGGA